MSEQVGNFTSLVRRTCAGSGGRTAADLISKSLVFISVGSNDLFEYADHLITEANNTSSSAIRNDTAFLQGLIASYKSNVKVCSIIIIRSCFFFEGNHRSCGLKNSLSSKMTIVY